MEVSIRTYSWILKEIHLFDIYESDHIPLFGALVAFGSWSTSSMLDELARQLS
jgi:hypothetical protein